LVESSSGEPPFKWEGEDLILQISVLPRSSINAIFGFHNNCLRIKLTAAPVDGKANQALVKFLSKIFGVSASHVAIEKGETGKLKRIRIKTPKLIPDFLKIS